MKMKRRFLDKMEYGELDTPDRGIGLRNKVVFNERTGKRERVYEEVEYHTAWEAAYLISSAGKTMEEANVRKLCREGTKLECVKFNSLIEEYVSGDATKLLNTVPWEVPVWALREYFEKNGLVDAGRAERPQVPASVAPGPVVAPVRAERHEVPASVAPGSVVAPVRAALPQVPASVAPGPVVAPAWVEQPQVPAIAHGSVVAPVRAERKVRWGYWDSCMVVIIVLCVIVLIVGAFVVVIILWKGL